MCVKLPASPLFTQSIIQAHIKKTSKLRVTDLCAGNSLVIGEFPAQMASNAENVSIWWRHHVHALNLYMQWSETHFKNSLWAHTTNLLQNTFES